MTRTTFLAILALAAFGWLYLAVETPADDPQPNREAATDHEHAEHEHAEVTRAVCVLQPVGDSGVSGTIYITVEGDKALIEGTVEGLTSGEHGFHVHEFGDLTDQEAGESAGGHYNPHGHAHGGPDDEERHPGDFGNIEANRQGQAEVRIEVTGLELSGEHCVLGRSLVVHANADDFSQPSGNAGPRVAFGVIGVAQAETP
jgi:Cu-Zn family superoxide dismutase